MIIIFRSCEANLSAGSLGSGEQDKPRWNGKGKLEILRKCYASLQGGITKDDTIIVLSDRTTTETLDWMRNSTKANFVVQEATPLSTLRQTHKYPDYHPVIANSAEELMELIVEIASTNLSEIIYVCEDDYLHAGIAIHSMKNIFSQGYKGFYVPYDYPDRYTIDRNKSCELHAGPYGHLRTIPSATLTMAALGATWLHFKYDLLRAGVFADDSWTWKAFAQVGAISPVPGHTTHLQDGCISPYVDWDSIYKEIVI
jgi:hypothetical protein